MVLTPGRHSETEPHLCPIIPRIHCPCPLHNDLSSVLLECPGDARRGDLARDGDALVLERDLVALDAWLVAYCIFAVGDAGIAVSAGRQAGSDIRDAISQQSARPGSSLDGRGGGRTALRRARL